MRLENFLLLVAGKTRIQWQNFCLLQLALAQGQCQISDFTLTAEEYQNVSRQLVLLPFNLLKSLYGLEYGSRQPVLVILQIQFSRILIQDIHRIGTTGHTDHWGVVKVSGEFLNVDGCRGHNNLELATLTAQALQITQQEIDIQTALMRLIDNNDFVFAE